jgi:hypothetical protein
MSPPGTSVMGATTDIGNPLAHPINITRIFCQRATGTCELSTAEYSPQDSQLFFATPFDYSIRTWEPTRITALSEHPCGTALMTIDIKTEAVTISSVPHADLPFCAKEGPTSWMLLDDGFPVTWKLHQDKVDAARALVFEPARKLMPIQK